jgi:hypothetical protein
MNPYAFAYISKMQLLYVQSVTAMKELIVRQDELGPPTMVLIATGAWCLKCTRLATGSDVSVGSVCDLVRVSRSASARPDPEVAAGTSARSSFAHHAAFRSSQVWSMLTG